MSTAVEDRFRILENHLNNRFDRLERQITATNTILARTIEALRTPLPHTLLYDLRNLRYPSLQDFGASSSYGGLNQPIPEVFRARFGDNATMSHYSQSPDCLPAALIQGIPDRNLTVANVRNRLAEWAGRRVGQRLWSVDPVSRDEHQIFRVTQNMAEDFRLGQTDFLFGCAFAKVYSCPFVLYSTTSPQDGPISQTLQGYFDENVHPNVIIHVVAANVETFWRLDDAFVNVERRGSYADRPRH